MHIDPLGTSAWNTVLVGRKRWVLMPPEVKKRLVKAKDFIRKREDDEAINYFIDQLPRLKEAHPELDITEFIQYPGETVFVPGGWWHAVLNLDDTLAVTQVTDSAQTKHVSPPSCSLDARFLFVNLYVCAFPELLQQNQF